MGMALQAVTPAARPGRAVKEHVDRKHGSVRGQERARVFANKCRAMARIAPMRAVALFISQLDRSNDDGRGE